MIGFIKNLFSGIISFFTGLAGGKKSLAGGKKSEENKPSQMPSAKKLAQDTTSSAEKLAEATAKTSKEAVSSVTGLVGGKKSQEKKRKRNGYFMELDEADQMQSNNGNQPAKTETAKKPEPATAAKTAKKPEPATAAKTAKQEPAKTQSTAEQPKKRVEFVQTATEIKEVVKTEPAKPVASANGQNEKTFAPKYLTPTNSNSRRRPGPSMSNFLDMARQVKSPAK